jgi:hypothetical protein
MEGHMKVHALIAVAFFALVPIAATAETAEEQQACMNDRVAACLNQNINRISNACRTVMLRYSKPAQSPRERYTTTRY